MKGGDIIRRFIHIQIDEQSNQFLWKKVPIKPKTTEKPYLLSHEVGNREEYFKAGFTKVYVHSTSPNEIDFIREFGKKVLPYFQEQNKKNR